MTVYDGPARGEPIGFLRNGGFLRRDGPRVRSHHTFDIAYKTAERPASASLSDALITRALRYGATGRLQRC